MAARDLSYKIVLSAANNMSGRINTAKGDLAKLEQRLKTSAGAANAFNKKWQQMINLAPAAGIAITAAGAGIVASLGAATNAAVKQEEVEDRLRKIYPENADALIEYAGAMQKATRYGDELVIQAMAIGATYPKLRSELEQATKTALNMAEAYGMDVVQAMHLLGKASAGQYGMLSRYGILIDKNAVKGDGMAEVYRAIAAETKNVAFTSEGGAKALAQMRNAIGDTAESVGMALLPVVQELAPRLQALAERAGQLAESDLGRGLILAAGGAGLLMMGIGPLLIALPTLVSMWGGITVAASAAWAAMTGPVGLAILGVVAVGAAIYGIATASERAERAQLKHWESLTVGAITSTEALEKMRTQTRGLADDLGDAAGEAGTLADAVEAARAAYVGDVFDERARVLEREAQLEAELARAKASYSADSRQALEAENRLIEEQQKLKQLDLALAQEQNRLGRESREGEDLWGNEEAQAQIRAEIDAIAELKREFGELEARRQENIRALEDLGFATGEGVAVTAALTEEEKKLADALEDAGDAATDAANAQRDAARDVEDAAGRIEDAQEGISEAAEDAAERVRDASRAAREAQEDYARAVEDAAERVQDAQEQAARSVEDAQDRIKSIQERIVELDQPELTPAQRKEKQRADLYKELAEAQTELAATRLKGLEDVRKAEEDGARAVEQAAQRVQDAEEAKVKAVEDGQKRIADAREKLAEAENAYALVVEKAGERIAAALDKQIDKYYELLAAQVAAGKAPNWKQQLADARKALDESHDLQKTAARLRDIERQAGVQSQGTPRYTGGPGAQGGASSAASPAYAPPGRAGGSQTVYVPQPQRGAVSGGVGGIMEALIRVALDNGLVVREASANAGQIIGSANGRQAVIRIVNDQMERRRS